MSASTDDPRATDPSTDGQRAPDPMSRISPERAFDAVIAIMKDRDQSIAHWTGRLLYVEGGLALAVGAIGTWHETISLMSVILTSTISFIGAILTFSIAGILRREYGWHRVYVGMLIRIEGKPQWLYQEEGAFTPIPGYRHEEYVATIRWGITVVWLAAAIGIPTAYGFGWLTTAMPSPSMTTQQAPTPVAGSAKP